jgi:hypothetical protein
VYDWQLDAAAWPRTNNSFIGAREHSKNGMVCLCTICFNVLIGIESLDNELTDIPSRRAIKYFHCDKSCMLLLFLG